MSCTVDEVLGYVKENDVKFVKLTFCDMFGRLKTLSLFAGGLKDAFRFGTAFDVPASSGLMNLSESDLLLFPQSATLSVLPWRPQTGRVVSLFCKLKHTDLTPFEYDMCTMLEKRVAALEKFGLSVEMSADCEFRVTHLDEDGNPTDIPFDKAGKWDTSPIDKCENVRRDVVLTLDSMGLSPICSYHERGKGQNRVVCRASDPSDAARRMLLMKSAIGNVCMKNGLAADFGAKPDRGDFGNGMHLKMTLKKDGVALPLGVPAADAFFEGVLSRLGEIAAFTNPSHASYERLAEADAPNIIGITPSSDPRFALKFDSSSCGFVLRSADCECNPFTVFALLLAAGQEGVEKKKKLRPVGDKSSSPLLPKDLTSALTEAEKSAFAAKVLTGEFVKEYVGALKR